MTGIPPGVYPDLDETAYHADPALSHSGAKLLRTTCPAKFKAAPREEKRVFDVGRAAHALVLGVGAPLVVVDRERWDTKAVKWEVAEIREAGKTPLRPSDYAIVQAMAAALRADPHAAALHDLGAGQAEVSMFWIDELPINARKTGRGEVTSDLIRVPRRARVDYQRVAGSTKIRIVDYKTTTNAHPDAVAKAVVNYGYDTQADWYTDAAFACLPDITDVGFGFVFQEKDPPYLCHAVLLDDELLADGAALNREALYVYARCLATDEWPAYGEPGKWTVIPRPRWRDQLDPTALEIPR